jgi:hypothetical protein
MRTTLSEGSHTVINGLSAGATIRAALQADRNRFREVGRLFRVGCLAVLWSLLVSTPVLAAPDEAAADRALSASGDPAASVQSAGQYSAVERRQPGTTTPGKASAAGAKRVYLDDYQLIPQAVTKKRPTEMVWLGQKSKTR